jgi:hypothetical protein
LPSQPEQTGFNLRRWNELGSYHYDPPAANHGSYQFEIGHLLVQRMRTGRVLTECPISTADGVRAARDRKFFIDGQAAGASKLYPDFPAHIQLR